MGSGTDAHGPGNYNAPQIRYHIVLAHSATHPFRSESATEASVGSTLSLFCQNRRREGKERFSCSTILSRHNPVPARPSAVPSSCISTVKLGAILHTYMGEVFVTVAGQAILLLEHSKDRARGLHREWR